jgi:hypothetical protein
MAVKQTATKILKLVHFAQCPVRGDFIRKHLGIRQDQYTAAIDYLSEKRLIGRTRGVGASIYA